MPARFQMRKGTAAQWSAANPVLLKGEPGAEWDTFKLKIGDGVTAWNSLAYVGGSGSGITQLTGDVTAGPGSGSQAATIANNAVSLAKMADIATDSILGRATAGTGDPEVLTALPFAFTGDVTRAADSNAQSIANDAVTTAKILDANVTLAKMADLAADRLIGRGNGGGTGVPQAISLGTGLSLSGTTLSASASGGVVPGLDPRSAIYNTFTPTGIDDEFNDNSFSGWTAVNDGSVVPTVTEANDRASFLHPGGGAASRLCAYVKAQTPGTNSTIEIAFGMIGRGQNFNICGLIMADGDTYNAGKQVVFYTSPQEAGWAKATFTGYNASTAISQYTHPVRNYPRVNLLRLKYEGSNNFSGWVSVDGQQWVNISGTFSRTLSPTHVGFFVTTWGGAQPHNFALDYFRYIP